MNEKTSAEQMYKEYLSEISADPAAIEDILSGERQPANPGARIKHTHGKWAAAVAAAAVMAVTVGVGITSGEDTSPQPSAQTSAPAVTTAAQKQLSPAAEKQNVSDNSQLSSSENAKNSFINATAEKAKLVNNRANEPDFTQLYKKYNLQQITAAKAVSDSNGSDIICAGVTSDKHFIAVICCKDSLARQVADSNQKKSLEFVLTDSSGNQLCSCSVDWCHKFSDTAVYTEIYSTDTINFKTLPEDAKLSCKNDTSFPNLSVTLTQAEMNTGLLNPGHIEPGL